MMIDSWLRDKRQQMIEDIMALVEVESVGVPSSSKNEPYGPGCRSVLVVADAICKRQGFTLENHENHCASFLWKGAVVKEIGIFGHLDVVPAGPGWTQDPFSVRLDGDILIGRGVADNKGAVVAVLHALEYLKESGYVPHNSIRMFLGCNEESGMKDVEYYLASHPMPHFSFTPDVEFPVCNGEKGIMDIRAEYVLDEKSILVDFSAGEAKNAVPGLAYALLRIDMEKAKSVFPLESMEQDGQFVKLFAKGIASHSAFPEGSKNAEVVLAQRLLDSGVLDEGSTRLMSSIVRIFGTCNGEGLEVPWEDELSGKLTHVGSKVRMERGTVCQHINIRYNIKANRTLLVQRIKRNLDRHGFRVTEVEDNPPSHFPADSAVITQLLSLVRTHLDLDASAYVMGGGTYARKLKNAIGFGPGNPKRKRPFCEGHGNAHQPDECVDMNDLMKATQIFVEAIPMIDRMMAENRL